MFVVEIKQNNPPFSRPPPPPTTKMLKGQCQARLAGVNRRSPPAIRMSAFCIYPRKSRTHPKQASDFIFELDQDLNN